MLIKRKLISNQLVQKGLNSLGLLKFPSWNRTLYNFRNGSCMWSWGPHWPTPKINTALSPEYLHIPVGSHHGDVCSVSYCFSLFSKRLFLWYTLSSSFLFFQFIYKIFTEALVKDKGYDSSLLQDNFEDLKDFWYEWLYFQLAKPYPFSSFFKYLYRDHGCTPDCVS